MQIVLSDIGTIECKGKYESVCEYFALIHESKFQSKITSCVLGSIMITLIARTVLVKSVNLLYIHISRETCFWYHNNDDIHTGKNELL